MESHAENTSNKQKKGIEHISLLAPIELAEYNENDSFNSKWFNQELTKIQSEKDDNEFRSMFLKTLKIGI